MKRAILIFTSILPKDIAMYPYPVDSKNLKAGMVGHMAAVSVSCSASFTNTVFFGHFSCLLRANCGLSGAAEWCLSLALFFDPREKCFCFDNLRVRLQSSPVQSRFRNRFVPAKVFECFYRWFPA